MSTAADFFRFADSINFGVEPFQKRIVRAIYGAQREVLVLLPRGNGKTTLLAAVALHHVLTHPRPAVYCAASSRDQARVLFEAALAHAKHPAVADRVTLRHLEMRVDGGHFRVIASSAPQAHGLSPTLCICDELQAHADGDLFAALQTALLKRPGAKLITITTAGTGSDSPLGLLRARAMAQPVVRSTGSLLEAIGPTLRMLEWAVPIDSNVDDPRAVKRANPGSWISAKGLAEQRDAVQDISFRRYHANQWIEDERHWLPHGAWSACAGDATIERGERVYVGVDVGGERSASAVVVVTEDLRVNAFVYQGDEAVLTCADKVRELAAEYEVMECVHDPWRFQAPAIELEREGMTVTAFPQSPARLIPASDRLYRAVIEKRLTHPNDPALNARVANAIAKDTPRGWRIDKPHGRAQIDALIALAMAVERAEQKPEPVRLIGWL
jgi:phage terminase large subunit-like protein